MDLAINQSRPRSQRLLVIAGSFREYRYYCNEHRLDPRRDARYVRTLQDVRGLGSDVQWVCYGTWAERWRELHGVLDYLRLLERTGRAQNLDGMNEGTVDELAPVVDEAQPRAATPVFVGFGWADAFSMQFGTSSGGEPI